MHFLERAVLRFTPQVVGDDRELSGDVISTNQSESAVSGNGFSLNPRDWFSSGNGFNAHEALDLDRAGGTNMWQILAWVALAVIVKCLLDLIQMAPDSWTFNGLNKESVKRGVVEVMHTDAENFGDLFEAIEKAIPPDHRYKPAARSVLTRDSGRKTSRVLTAFVMWYIGIRVVALVVLIPLDIYLFTRA